MTIKALSGQTLNGTQPVAQLNSPRSQISPPFAPNIASAVTGTDAGGEPVPDRLRRPVDVVWVGPQPPARSRGQTNQLPASTLYGQAGQELPDPIHRQSVVHKRLVGLPHVKRAGHESDASIHKRHDERRSDILPRSCALSQRRTVCLGARCKTGAFFFRFISAWKNLRAVAQVTGLIRQAKRPSLRRPRPQSPSRKPVRNAFRDRASVRDTGSRFPT